MSSNTTLKIKDFKEWTMPCKKCGSTIEQEKPDPKTKIYSSTGTKTPYCWNCYFDQWIKQERGVGNDYGVLPSGGRNNL